jgi:hypothetical protein
MPVGMVNDHPASARMATVERSARFRWEYLQSRISLLTLHEDDGRHRRLMALCGTRTIVVEGTGVVYHTFTEF